MNIVMTTHADPSLFGGAARSVASFSEKLWSGRAEAAVEAIGKSS